MTTYLQGWLLWQAALHILDWECWIENALDSGAGRKAA